MLQLRLLEIGIDSKGRRIDKQGKGRPGGNKGVTQQAHVRDVTVGGCVNGGPIQVELRLFQLHFRTLDAKVRVTGFAQGRLGLIQVGIGGQHGSLRLGQSVLGAHQVGLRFALGRLRLRHRCLGLLQARFHTVDFRLIRLLSGLLRFRRLHRPRFAVRELLGPLGLALWLRQAAL